MKKLNITKEAFNKSKYFQNKYGKLEYVSESGKVYKTNKNVILEFTMPSFGEIGDALDDGVSKIKELLHKKPRFKVGDYVNCYAYSDGKGKGKKVGVGKVIDGPNWRGAINAYMYEVKFPFSGGLNAGQYSDSFPEYRMEPGDEQQYEHEYDEYKKFNESDDFVPPYANESVKRLNITKKRFNESKYFQNKYGKLEYVSESGKVYKTDKGNLIKFIGESKEITIRDIVHKHKRGLEQALNTLVGLREDIKNHFGEDSIYFVQVNSMISDFQDALYDGDDEEMQFDESKKSLLKDVDESIMSAKKVRSMKKGKQINYKVYRDGMKRIENDIKSAAEDGDTSMYWNIFEELEWPFVGDSPEFDMCIKELKQAGYKVELGDFDEDYQRLTVSWDE